MGFFQSFVVAHEDFQEGGLCFTDDFGEFVLEVCFLCEEGMWLDVNL